jgi:hypothetical protein
VRQWRGLRNGECASRPQHARVFCCTAQFFESGDIGDKKTAVLEGTAEV